VYERASLGAESGGIYLGSLDAKPEQQDTKRLAASLSLRYAPSPDPGFGYVLFVREGALMALPFDARRLEPTGAAVPIAEGILTSGPPSFSASATGVLAFRTGPSSTNSKLLWFDRQGKQLGQAGPDAPYANIQLSPDGKLLVVDHQFNLTGDHLWAGDAARGVFSRVNPGDIRDYAGGAVSSDGRVAFNFRASDQSRFGVQYDGMSDENLRVTERFTRTGPHTITYRATVLDPTVYRQPWTVELPMEKTESSVYEYACHEGNYGLAGILSGARAQEKAALKK